MVLIVVGFKRGKRPPWSTDSLVAALTAVRKGHLSTYKAAAHYGIPRRTLRNHLEARYFGIEKSPVRNAVFTREQEREFVNHVIQFSELGIPITPKMLRIQAFKFCQELNIPNNFNEESGLAGKGWLRLFLRRNPDLEKLKSSYSTQGPHELG